MFCDRCVCVFALDCSGIGFNWVNNAVSGWKAGYPPPP